MIKVTQKGEFEKLTTYLEKRSPNNRRTMNESIKARVIEHCENGISALEAYTPRDTGKTAASWYYTIEENQNGIIINFNNSNVVKGVNIAVILQYGHATKNGGWVEGRDYINPALAGVFDDITEKIVREVAE